MSNLSYILKTLFRRGPGFIYLYLKDSLAFDLIYGTNTHLRVPKPESSGNDREHQDGLLYVASLTSVVRTTLCIAERILGTTQFNNSQFLDLGCGKGKTLMVYALKNGRRATHPAVGIEYASNLCEVALRNVARVSSVRNRIAIHCDSATNLNRYISGSTLIVYIYNSFQGDTFRSVLQELRNVPHVLIYVDPVEREILSQHGYEVAAQNRGKLNATTWLVATSTSLRARL